MIFERLEELPDGTSRRHREVQTELAEWERVGPRCWVRRMKEWERR